MRTNQHALAPRITLLCLLLTFLVPIGCSKESAEPAAPLGDISVLENLAASYSQITEKLDMNVHAMPANEKRKFIEDVFKKSGYDYARTLHAVRNTRLDPFNKEQKDLVELLLVPTVGLSVIDLESFYGKDEIEAIEHMKDTF